MTPLYFLLFLTASFYSACKDTFSAYGLIIAQAVYPFNSSAQ
nr:MAG TPA_asm: hypothetical protein [Caudoviricetes sp.]